MSKKAALQKDVMDTIMEQRKAVTMADIAKVLHLSVATVSRALNGSNRIGGQTIALVKATADEMGFVINADARRLSGKGAQNTPARKKNVTITDLALALKISASTVSRCFAPNGDVSRATKARVLKAAAEIGFTIQEHARRLRNKKTLVIGVLLPPLADSSIIGILRGIKEEAGLSGFDILISNTLSDPPDAGQQHFLSVIDALIFVPDGLTYAGAQANGLPDHKPMVVLTRDDIHADSNDPLAWGRLAVRRILQYLSGKSGTTLKTKTIHPGPGNRKPPMRAK